jgi:hypothetical protein
MMGSTRSNNQAYFTLVALNLHRDTGRFEELCEEIRCAWQAIDTIAHFHVWLHQTGIWRYQESENERSGNESKDLTSGTYCPNWIFRDNFKLNMPSFDSIFVRGFAQRTSSVVCNGQPLD